MMFIADAAFALELLALATGVFLLLKAYKEDIPFKAFTKFVSYFVIVTAFLGMLCTTTYVIRYMMNGYFAPMGRMMQGPCDCGMQRGQGTMEQMHKGMMDSKE